MKKHTVYHNDGSIWATGARKNGIMEGYWEWFRKDGTTMRSGHFSKGEQTGEWKTYDTKGKVHTVKVLGNNEFPKTSAPAARALANANIKTLKDLSKWTEKELLTLHGIGPSAIPILKAALKKKGLSFK